MIASEEEDVPVAVEQSYSGNYIVVFDPLDGSSNIDAAVSTGSIFGIYAPNDECLANVEDNETVSANNLVSLPSGLAGWLMRRAAGRSTLNVTNLRTRSLTRWSRGAL